MKNVSVVHQAAKQFSTFNSTGITKNIETEVFELTMSSNI